MCRYNEINFFLVTTSIMGSILNIKSSSQDLEWRMNMLETGQGLVWCLPIEYRKRKRIITSLSLGAKSQKWRIYKEGNLGLYNVYFSFENFNFCWQFMQSSFCCWGSAFNEKAPILRYGLDLKKRVWCLAPMEQLFERWVGSEEGGSVSVGSDGTIIPLWWSRVPPLTQMPTSSPTTMTNITIENHHHRHLHRNNNNSNYNSNNNTRAYHHN